MRRELANAELRLRLWSELRKGLGLEPCLPLSERQASLRAAEVAQAATEALAGSIQQARGDGASNDGALAWLGRRLLFRRTRHAEFGDVVGAQAARAIAEAGRQGMLGESARRQMAAKIRARLAELPPELRDESVRSALRSGDKATLALLAAGGPLVGLDIAVELAGFSPYSLAAQAAAMIPFLGSQTAVVWLAVLASPWFILPALAGGWWLASDRVGGSIRRKLAASLATTATLRLDLFKTLPMNGPSAQDGDRHVAYLPALKRVTELNGQVSPETPGSPPGRLAGTPVGRTAAPPIRSVSGRRIGAEGFRGGSPEIGRRRL